MKAKFTPGPWTIKSIEGDNIVFNSDHHSICEVFYDGSDTPNAKLIAAAPDLLEALNALMSEIDKGNLVRDISQDHKDDWQIRQLPLFQALSKAATAIKKATE